jgi:hypothetical protein
MNNGVHLEEFIRLLAKFDSKIDSNLAKNRCKFDGKLEQNPSDF